ncbi:hypothetical protein EDB89DRAFT_553832 [Lactarius sanguifluus]|nr:hypothetical protein EDB89DRAFT_553832 [Lactarius sanguifluus]
MLVASGDSMYHTASPSASLSYTFYSITSTCSLTKGSGPPSDYFTCVLMCYAVDLDLCNDAIHTYVNDHDIIDKLLL